MHKTFAALTISALTISPANLPAGSVPETSCSTPASTPAKRKIARVAKNVAGQRVRPGKRDVAKGDHYLTAAESRSLDQAVRGFEDRRGITRAKFQTFCFKTFKEQAQ